MPSKLPWTAVRDEYGSTGIVDADGEYIVEELATEQEGAAENAEMIVNAVNASQILDQIYEILDGKEWDSDTTAAIAGTLAASGRIVREPAPEPTKYVHQFLTPTGWDTSTNDDGTPSTFDTQAEAEAELEIFHDEVAAAVSRGDMDDHNRADWRVAELEG